MILYYKNSILASIVSILGCLFLVVSIQYLTDGEIGEGIMGVAISAALLIGGKVLSNRKAFKKWWKQVEDANLEPAIREDVNTALQVYQKNPQKRTLKKIAALNPIAAGLIAANKKKK